jgi:hypothetical protein
MSKQFLGTALELGGANTTRPLPPEKWRHDSEVPIA